MNNKLPEKLTYLRKSYQYSQGDVAAHVGVPVTEYMNWENGNSICSIKQLKQLADLYQVSLDDLADNTKTVIVPEETLEQSAVIPFMHGADINSTQVIDEPSVTSQSTIQMTPVQDFGETKVVDTTSITQQMQYDDEDDEEEEEPAKINSSKRKKQSAIIIAGVAFIVVLVAVLIMLLNGKGTTVSVTDDNRLAVGDTYTLYVNSDGTVKTYGDFTSNTSFSSAVQVSAYQSHAVGLTSGGKVISNYTDDDFSGWNDVIYIAAGKNHTAGATSEGKVLCLGSENACNVSNWSNIAKVYAGDELTIGLSNDGTLSASGTAASTFSGITNVRDVSISSQFVTITKKDGTVSTYAIGNKSVYDTSTWSDVTSTGSGTSMVAGLKSDGTVVIASDNEEVTSAVSGWSNMRYIAVGNDTIVGIDKTGVMYGAGDNSHNQYENPESDEPEKEPEELDEPQNIQVSVTTANIVIKWDTVENADYYEVTVDTDPVTSTTTSSNSASVPTTSLIEGQTYTITVIAKSDDEENYTSSTGSVTYVYEAKTVQLATPENITAISGAYTWTISWSEVANADYYMISLDGSEEIRTETNSYTFSLESVYLTEGVHNISVTAHSVVPTYTTSEIGRGQVTYEPAVFNISVTFIDSNSTTIGSTVVQAIAGTYSYEQLVGSSLPEGYTLATPEGQIIISSDASTQIIVNPVNH